jgi:hypothetical protein
MPLPHSWAEAGTEINATQTQSPNIAARAERGGLLFMSGLPA